MFRSQSSDHHQESITVLVQLLLIDVHASSYSGNVAVCCLYVCLHRHGYLSVVSVVCCQVEVSATG